MQFRENFNEPPPFREKYEERMEGSDKGIINAWLAGIQHRRDGSEWQRAAEAGELPVLPYRGGVSKKTKKSLKVGVLHYLAMWQGLRGEDLAIDTDDEPIVTCSKFGVSVLLTNDFSKLTDPSDD